MKKYLVQCWFSYGWDDAGWYLDEKPHRFNSITEAEAERLLKAAEQKS